MGRGAGSEQRRNGQSESWGVEVEIGAAGRVLGQDVPRPAALE